MNNRTFMDVPHVLQTGEDLRNYSEIQLEMIEEYYATAMRMVDDMEGKSKESLRIAATHIYKETLDAIRRMEGFNIIYTLTGKNRLLIDKEATVLAQSQKCGTINGSKK